MKRGLGLRGMCTASSSTVPRTASTKLAACQSVTSRSGLPTVVLARPYEAGNIGAAARAMLNFGLADLRLAAPECHDWCNREALHRASGAAGLLQLASSFDTVQDATADLQLVLATTARPRDVRLPVYTPAEAARVARQACERGQKVGFLFGCERNGLSNDEMSIAHGIVTVPTEPNFGSINLAQAVLLMSYEWRQQADAGVRLVVETNDPPAPLAHLTSFFNSWESRLWDAGFFGLNRRDDVKTQDLGRATATMSVLRSLVMRSQPSTQEVSLLRGTLQALAQPTEKRRT